MYIIIFCVVDLICHLLVVFCFRVLLLLWLLLFVIVDCCCGSVAQAWGSWAKAVTIQVQQ